jgi:hypothetical protein
MHLLELFPQRIKRIRGEGSIDEVASEAIEVIDALVRQEATR